MNQGKVEVLDLSNRVPGHTVIVKRFHNNETTERWEFWIDGKLHYSAADLAKVLDE